MPVPVFVYHEILIRVQGVNPGVGDYLSSMANGETVKILTTAGTVFVPNDLLQKQFRDPSTISDDELKELAANFAPAI